MSTYDLVADLPVRIDGYELQGLKREVSSDFTRQSTVIRLHGRGEEGLGEDVVYDSVDQEAARQARATLPLQGDWTMRSFAEHLATLELFPREPQEQVSRLYRTWAYESAALDLALRQAGEPLHAVLGRPAQPLRFVVSLRLGDPPSLEKLTSRLERYPALRFKLDPTSEWDEQLIAGLAETRAIEVVDFKGHYNGSVMEQPPDLTLYRRIVDALDEVWFEDPNLTPEIDTLLAPHRSRITWDARIHSARDIDALRFAPQMVNFKPSRMGGLKRLLDAYDYAEANGIGAYGGGMYELGPGRGQIQYLASLFHPDAPNDTSPEGFLLADLPSGLPDGPLAPAPAKTGFRWSD